MRMVGAKQLGIISRTAIFPCRLCQNWRDGVCVHKRELMIKLPLVDRIKFLVERQFVRGAGFQLLIVAIVIGLISLIGGVAVHWSGSEGSLLDSVWWAFLRLTDPGYLGDDQGTWRRIVSTVLTVSGYVVFLGALVAIKTQWLIARMREFERGLTPVSLRQHIVIVGWSNRTLPLLRELVGNERVRRQFQSAFDVRRLRAVVLSEGVSAAQAQAMRADPMLGRFASQVVLRDGSPLEEEAIHRAGCLNAAVVIMPTDFGRADSLISADVTTIRSLLSIDARAEEHGHKPPLVVAEIQDMRRREMARNAYRGPLEIVPSDDSISRLLTQNLIHPGLAAFFREVLTAHDGNEIFMRSPGKLTGATLKDVSSQCPSAILLGLVREVRGKPAALLNLTAAERVQEKDQLIMLARQFDDTEPVSGPGKRLPGLDRPSVQPALRPRTQHHRVLILGWNQRIPNLLMELASYPDERFVVDLFSSTDVALRRREIEQYNDGGSTVEVNHFEGDFMLTGELDRMDLTHYSAILLIASDRLANEEEADARAIVGHRLIESLLKDKSKRPQILLELSDPANEGLIRMPGAETVVSPLIISHLLARIAVQPSIRLVFDELFSVGGAEIEFRRGTEYGLAGAHAFGRIERGVAERGETLLGIELCNAGQAPQLLLNPKRDKEFELGEAARLCVLTSRPPT